MQLFNKDLNFLISSDGPSNAKMTVTPMMHVYRTGSNITMSCSVDSSPTAMIQWMFNGVNLNHFTPWLHLDSITESSSGNYQCLYHNPVTSRFTTACASIHVMGEVLFLSLTARFHVFVGGNYGAFSYLLWNSNQQLFIWLA